MACEARRIGGIQVGRERIDVRQDFVEMRRSSIVGTGNEISAHRAIELGAVVHAGLALADQVQYEFQAIRVVRWNAHGLLRDRAVVGQARFDMSRAGEIWDMPRNGRGIYTGKTGNRFPCERGPSRREIPGGRLFLCLALVNLAPEVGHPEAIGKALLLAVELRRHARADGRRRQEYPHDSSIAAFGTDWIIALEKSMRRAFPFLDNHVHTP